VRTGPLKWRSCHHAPRAQSEAEAQQDVCDFIRGKLNEAVCRFQADLHVASDYVCALSVPRLQDTIATFDLSGMTLDGTPLCAAQRLLAEVHALCDSLHHEVAAHAYLKSVLESVHGPTCVVIQHVLTTLRKYQGLCILCATLETEARNQVLDSGALSLLAKLKHSREDRKLYHVVAKALDQCVTYTRASARPLLYSFRFPSHTVPVTSLRADRPGKLWTAVCGTTNPTAESTTRPTQAALPSTCGRSLASHAACSIPHSSTQARL
jgi:hypothetical protein